MMTERHASTNLTEQVLQFAIKWHSVQHSYEKVIDKFQDLKEWNANELQIG